MRPSSVLAASLAATFMLSALPDDALGQDRARERERQRQIERERDRSLDLERRQRAARDRLPLRELDVDRMREEARAMARAYGGSGGAYTYSYGGVDDDRPVIGISMTTEGMRDTLGVLVASVAPDGPAERAGLRVGDRIVSVNGVSLRMSPEDARDPETSDIGTRRLEREIRRLRAGDAVELRVYSNGQTRTVRVNTVAASALARSSGGAGAYGGALREMLPSRDDAERRAAIGVSHRRHGQPPRHARPDDHERRRGRPGRAGRARRGRPHRGHQRRGRARLAERPRGEMTSADPAQRFTRELSRLAPGDEAELRVFSEGRYRTVRVRTGPRVGGEPRRRHGLLLQRRAGVHDPAAAARAAGPMAPRAPMAPGRIRVMPGPMTPPSSARRSWCRARRWRRRSGPTPSRAMRRPRSPARPGVHAPARVVPVGHPAGHRLPLRALDAAR
jgi:hypothetical protein